MSDGVSPRPNLSLQLGLALGGAMALVLLILYALRTPPGSVKNDPGKVDRPEEQYLAQARTLLAKQTNLPTCRTVVQLLNQHNQTAREHPPALADTASATLREQLGLSADDLREITSDTYTALDAHHLDSCFLFRDAARSLEIPPLTGSGNKTAQQSPLDRAVAGFDWVVRQVRLLPMPKSDDSEQAPAAAIVRRGQGSPIQRALVFLALLEQFGLDDTEGTFLQGCLVQCPDDRGRERLWACGVITSKQPEALYLFDPRVGLPIPGANGKGVATLAEVRSNPAILQQWTIDKRTYDVTPEQAKQSSAFVVVALSALAPRMQFLQDRLLRDRMLEDQPLPAPIRVRLAEDAGAARAAIQAAMVKSGGKADDVRFWPEGSGIMRQFLSVEEGGIDRGGKKKGPSRAVRFQFNTVPWGEYPRILSEAVESSSEMGTQLSRVYASPFLLSLADPNSAREMLLRGRFRPAVQIFVKEQERMLVMRSRLQEARGLGPQIVAWLEQEAIPAYAEQSRSRGTAQEAVANARVASLWHWRGGEPIEILINGSIAGPRGAEVSYELALCRHEQAVRSQLRVALASKIDLVLSSDARAAQGSWLDAAGYWKEFLDNNPNRPGFASAQQLRGEALFYQGEKAEAVKLWNDLAAPQSDLERLGRLWLARQRGKP